MADVIDDILRAWDDDQFTALILLDYSKAFDLICHEILLAILQYTGFSTEAIDFFKSFLSDRLQQVLLDGLKSPTASLSVGVPQGSILGPLLYTIYTSQFKHFLKFCFYHLYADDTQLYFHFPLKDLLTAARSINSDLEDLIKVSMDHHLKINPSKSSITLFGGDKKLRSRVSKDLNIQINNIPIPITDTSKSLGLIIDSDLRFHEHITDKLKKAYSALKLIYNQRKYLSKDIKKVLCDSLVLSNFNHCDVVYGPYLDQVDFRRIQKVQNSCLRLIFGIRRRNRISHKLKDIGWLNMFNRRKMHTISMSYKIIKYKTPKYVYDKVNFRSNIHHRNLRNMHRITIPKHRKELFKRSFTYNLSLSLNPLNITNFDLSCCTFQKQIKQLLLSTQ